MVDISNEKWNSKQFSIKKQLTGPTSIRYDAFYHAKVNPKFHFPVISFIARDESRDDFIRELTKEYIKFLVAKNPILPVDYHHLINQNHITASVTLEKTINKKGWKRIYNSIKKKHKIDIDPNDM